MSEQTKHERTRHHIVSPKVYVVILLALLVGTGAHGVGVVSRAWPLESGGRAGHRHQQGHAGGALLHGT